MKQFLLDGQPVPFDDGQTILEAARAAGHYIPSLCWHKDFPPHGSCKLCVVKSAGRHVSACATPAKDGAEVESNTPEMNGERRGILQMLFVEGNHFCPSCEKSGNCELQALGYEYEMLTPRFRHFFPDRPVDASHPDVLLDFNRCIFCELCVRASRDLDGKNLFGIAGRGLDAHLCVNSASGKLGDTNFSARDRAASICPCGAILPRRKAFLVPIGERRFDSADIGGLDTGGEGDGR